jgi:hypothetical protein
MRYPLGNPSSVIGSGSSFYLYLLENIHVPAKMSHDLWYKGLEQAMKEDTSYPFRGFFPVGETLKISYAGAEIAPYTFTGSEKNPVYVKDLSSEAKLSLGISVKADPSAEVFNPHFVAYAKLPERTRKSNELPTLSLAKSISSYLGSKDILFTEKDIIDFLISAFKDCNSNQMKYILHGNHVAWCAARFMETNTMEEDIKKQFYGQNSMDFYIKDIGTILPGMLFCAASLGMDPVEAIKYLDYDVWDIDKVARALQCCMKEKEIKKVA